MTPSTTSSTTSSTTPSTDPSTLRRRVKNKKHAPPSPPSPTDDDPSAKFKRPSHLAELSIPLLPVSITLLDASIMLIMLALALFVRFRNLNAIQSVIFDEVHYLNFDNNILNRRYFFDVNPVFGKLAIAYAARLLGYDPNTPYLALGQPLSSVQAFAARAPAALFGALTVPVFYRVCRLLRLTTYASVMGAIFILFDSMHVIQSRIAMVDSVLVFFTCLSMLCALLMWDAKNIILIKGQNVALLDVFYMLFLLVVTGINCGLAVSVRWTSFATPALIFTISLFGVGPFCRSPLNILELFILYGSAFVGYCGSFVVFLWQVNTSGPGDGFMSEQFQACIEGSKFWKDSSSCKLSLWKRIVELNATIFHYSKGIRGNDKWGSSWFQWIVNWRGALYYRNNVGSDLAMIYVLMNPVMTFCIDFLMCAFVATLFYNVRNRRYYTTTEAFKEHLRRGSALFFAWVGSMLPTMVVYRSGPVYQYLPGLFFAQAMAAVGFDLIPRKLRPACALLFAGGIVTAFVYWSPWVYGVPLSHADHLKRRWLPRWD